MLEVVANVPCEVDGVEVGVEQIDLWTVFDGDVDRDHRDGELEADDKGRREVEVGRAVPDRGADAAAPTLILLKKNSCNFRVNPRDARKNRCR